jgi:DNA-binding transcriptional LysR family regulator
MQQARCFVAVVDCGGFTQAAHRLFMTQPAISFQVSNLEKALGVRLLTRGPAKVTPTPEGFMVFEVLSRVLTSVSDLQEMFRKGEWDLPGRLSVASVASVGQRLLEAAIPEFSRRFPAAMVSFNVVDGNSLKAASSNCDLIVGVTRENVQLAEGAKRSELCRVPLYLAGKAPSPFFRRSEVGIRDIVGLSFVLPPAGWPLRERINALFAANGAKPHITVEVQNAAIAKKVALSGSAYTIIPQSECEEEVLDGRLFAVPLMVTTMDGLGLEQMTEVVSLITGPRADEKLAQVFVEVLRDVCRRAVDGPMPDPLHIEETAISRVITTLMQELLRTRGGTTIGCVAARSLERVAKSAYASRAYIFRYDWERCTMSNTYEWCADGVTPEIQNLQDIQNALFPEWIEAHRKGSPVYIGRVSDLQKDSALREILESQGISSLVTVPVWTVGECKGFIGFDAIDAEASWSDVDIGLLVSFAKIIGSICLDRSGQLCHAAPAHENAHIACPLRFPGHDAPSCS